MKFSFFILVVALLLTSSSASSQIYKIRGTVYDSSRNFPMEAVSVLSTSGRGVITNADGHYEIEVIEKDSIWFSYLNKPTMKFPVLKIINPFQFDISLQVNVPLLKEVKVRPRNYKQDSIQNRIDYAKAFDFTKPGIGSTLSPTGAGVGLDINEFINMFRFRRNRRMLAFQERLLREEADRYIDHRFNKALIRRLTGLSGGELDSFVVRYRPDLEFTDTATDYEFQQYIKLSFAHYQRLARMKGELFREDP